jgi:hypothetical protein
MRTVVGATALLLAAARGHNKRPHLPRLDGHGVMLTHNCPGIDRRSPVSAGWSTYESSSAAEPPVRITVDEEVFDVTTQPDHPGAYHYAWISGPNPDYGFSSASSDGRPSTMVDHEEAIRNFLSLVDPETGYIE